MSINSSELFLAATGKRTISSSCVSVVVCVPVVCPASDPRLIFFTFNQVGKTMEDGNNERVAGLLEQLRREREEREEEREQEKKERRREREGSGKQRKKRERERESWRDMRERGREKRGIGRERRESKKGRERERKERDGVGSG